jgi:hypothetical protein
VLAHGHRARRQIIGSRQQRVLALALTFNFQLSTLNHFPGICALVNRKKVSGKICLLPAKIDYCNGPQNVFLTLQNVLLP